MRGRKGQTLRVPNRHVLASVFCIGLRNKKSATFLPMQCLPPSARAYRCNFFPLCFVGVFFFNRKFDFTEETAPLSISAEADNDAL